METKSTTKITEEYFITRNGVRIEADWNSFDSIDEAIEEHFCNFGNNANDKFAIVFEKKTVIVFEIQ